jgi:phage recombination protein Bet
VTETTPTTPPVPREASVLEAYAQEHGLSARRMYDTLAATIFPSKQSATPEQVNALLIVARAHGLNPFTREVYAFPAKGGAIVPIVSVDGWAKLANSHPACDGIELHVEMAADGRTPISATCRVYRRDWRVPLEVTEYLHEVKRNTDPWNKQPVRMLRHRALIQAIRIAFGFGGLYEADEAARRPDVVAPPEYREATVVRADPLARELESTNGAQPPREGLEVREDPVPAVSDGGGDHYPAE